MKSLCSWVDAGMDETEKRIIEIIDRNSSEIIDFAEDLFGHGECGFHEVRTAGKVAAVFHKLGLEVRENIAVTGVKAEVGTGEAAVAVLGELDGIKCDSHPSANRTDGINNGIAHACGHHIQLGALIGTAMALSDSVVAGALGGRAVFLAVPAEEHVGPDVTGDLLKEGRIRYGSGGKSEFLRLGIFDGIDAAVVHHVHYNNEDCDALLGCNSSNGFMAKTTVFRGRAAHAAAEPHKGINALNAASLALSALAFQRETFRDEDCVRVHSAITSGTGAVNVVPKEVSVETLVRGKTLEAIKDAGEKTDRAFRGAAYCIGAEAEITNYPGYMPVIASPAPAELLHAASLLGKNIKTEKADLSKHNALSTDVGDLTHVMPVVGFTTGGFRGALHSSDFAITDPYKAYIVPAKLMALTVYGLLKNGAAGAVKLHSDFKPVLEKRAYLDYMESFKNDTVHKK